MSTLEHAIALAACAHAGQVDKAGQPYILHPLRVMLRLSGADERIVAVLHDVVEDTPRTIERLRALVLLFPTCSPGRRTRPGSRAASWPGPLTILLQWDDLTSAREFVQNPNLHEVMKQGGVLGKPDVTFLDEGSRTRI
jgi:hypothetical protein